MKSRSAKSKGAQASRLWKPLAPLLIALFIPACATKKDSPPPAPENLEAVFVEGPASPKTNPLAGLGSFFSNLLPKKSPKAPPATPVQWAGEIRMVNVAENFVLVESNSAASTVPGEKYTALRDGRETGVLRMTALRNPPFLIADIVSGNPSPGDKIHLPGPVAPAPTPSPEADVAQPAKPSPVSRLSQWFREILPKPRPKP
jgi:hypothetical protein